MSYINIGVVIPENDQPFKLVFDFLDKNKHFISYIKLSNRNNIDKLNLDCILFLGKVNFIPNMQYGLIDLNFSKKAIYRTISTLVNCSLTKDVGDNELITPEEEESDSIIIDISDITKDSLDEFDIGKLKIKDFTVSLNDTIITISKSEVLTLLKLDNLIKDFGFKIQKIEV